MSVSLFWYKNVRGYTLYRRARIPPWHPAFVRCGTNLSLHRGYLFYSRGLLGIIDAQLGAMSVHIKVSWCVDAFVCVCQMLCFCRSLWTSHHLVTLNVHSQHPLTAHSMSSHSCTHYMSTHRTHTGHTQDTHGRTRQHWRDCYIYTYNRCTHRHAHSTLIYTYNKHTIYIYILWTHTGTQ
jgi:hypothetical protein